MATLDELVVRLESDSTGLNKGFDSAQRGIGKTEKSLSGLGKLIGVAFAGAAVIEFGRATINAASDAEELGNKYGVVFSGIEQSTQSWIEAYTDATARGEQATKEYLTSLQDIRTGFGDSTDNAAKFSQAVVGVTNDLSSFSNVDFDRASAAIQSGLSGQFEALRSLGVGINVAIINQSDYAQSINKTWKEMTNLEKQEAILNQVIQQSKNAVGQSVSTWQEYDFTLGDAANTSEDFANQQKLLGQTLQDTAAEIGQVFIPQATKLISSLINGLQSARPFIVATFQTLVDWINTASNFVGLFVRMFTRDISTIVSVMGQLTGISKRATRNNIDDANERIEALKKEKEERIKALKDQQAAEKATAGVSAEQSKKALNAKKDALKEELDAVKDTTDEIIEAREEETELAIEEIDKQLDALKEAQKERIKQIDEEFDAKIKLLDQETQARIKAIESQKESIEAEQEAVDLAERTRQEKEKLAQLEKKIAEADTSEERAFAEKDLVDFNRELRLRDEEERRQAEIERLENTINNIESEARSKEEALEQERDQYKERAKEIIEIQIENLNDQKDLLNNELEAFIKTQEAKVEVAQQAYDSIKQAASSASEEIQSVGASLPDISIEDQIESLESEYDELIKVQEEKLNEYSDGNTSKTSEIVDNIIGFFKSIKETVEPITEGLVLFITTLWENHNQDLQNIFSMLGSLFETTFEFVKAIINAFASFWAEWGDEITRIASDSFKRITNIIEIAIKLIENILKIATALISGDWEEAWNLIKKTTSDVLIGIYTIIQDNLNAANNFLDLFFITFSNAIDAGFNAAYGIVQEILNDIFGFFVDIFNDINDYLLSIDFFRIGADLLTGLIDGVKSVSDDLVDSVKKPVEDAVKGVKDFLGIRSPSRLFKGIGVNVGEGFVSGIDDTVTQSERALNELVSPISSIENTPNVTNNVTRNPQVIVQNMTVRDESDIGSTSRRLFDLQDAADKSSGLLPLGV